MFTKEKANAYRAQILSIFVLLILTIQLMMTQILWPFVLLLLIISLLYRTKTQRYMSLLGSAIVYTIYYESLNLQNAGMSPEILCGNDNSQEHNSEESKGNYATSEENNLDNDEQGANPIGNIKAEKDENITSADELHNYDQMSGQVDAAPIAANEANEANANDDPKQTDEMPVNNVGNTFEVHNDSEQSSADEAQEPKMASDESDNHETEEKRPVAFSNDNIPQILVAPAIDLLLETNTQHEKNTADTKEPEAKDVDTSAPKPDVDDVSIDNEKQDKDVLQKQDDEPELDVQKQKHSVVINNSICKHERKKVGPRIYHYFYFIVDDEIVELLKNINKNEESFFVELKDKDGKFGVSLTERANIIGREEKYCFTELVVRINGAHLIESVNTIKLIEHKEICKRNYIYKYYKPIDYEKNIDKTQLAEREDSSIAIMILQEKIIIQRPQGLKHK